MIQSLKDLLSLMKDAETGQRGYLLTGRRESYLQPYHDAIASIGRKLDELSALASNAPKAQRKRPGLTRFETPELQAMDV